MKRFGIRHWSWVFVLAGCLVSLCIPPNAYASVARTSSIPKTAVKAKMPFVANEGQISDVDVRFMANTLGGTVSVKSGGELVYSFRGVKTDTGKGKPVATVVLKESFSGGSPVASQITGEDLSATKVNQFMGSDPAKWRSNVATYNTVRLGEVYNGIELKLKAYANNVEKLFFVKPGANPQEIKVKLSGAKGLSINAKGELEAATEEGIVAFTRPVAYQMVDGKRTEVAAVYRLLNGGSRYGFTVGDYDRSQELVIDPLLASTFIGGSLDDMVYGIAESTTGEIYVTGQTNSTDAPATTGAYDTTANGSYDVFVAKFSADLKTLLAFTLFGGSDNEVGLNIKLDASNNVFICGYTRSNNFPVTSDAYDTTYNGGGDGFLAKFSSDLSTLIGSTYIGGSYVAEFSTESLQSIAIDASGNIYGAGVSYSSDFPTTTGAFDRTYGGGYWYGDGVVVKFSSDLKALLASTLIGGNWGDTGQSVLIDASGDIFVSGLKEGSSDFPSMAGAYMPSGGQGYVAKFNPDLTTLLATTNVPLQHPAIKLGPTGDVYVLGGNNGMLKLNAGLTTLSASRNLGDIVTSKILVNQTGEVYVMGYTTSTSFPVTSGAYDTTFNSGSASGVVMRLSSDLNTVVASTFIGGGVEGISGLFSRSGDLILAGMTTATDFPITTGAYDTTYNGGAHDGFIARLSPNLSLSPVENVTTGFNYATIQAAIDAAETLAGHTIYVSSGTYTEHVVINKAITLQGANRDTTIIDGGGTGNVVAITANNVTVSGFTIRNGGNLSSNPYNAGVRITSVGSATVKECNITTNYFGIMAYPSSSNNTFKDSKIYGNSANGIELGDQSSQNNVIENNEIYSNSTHGVDGYAGSNGTIVRNNVIHDNVHGGIVIGWSSGCLVESNKVYSNGEWGIVLDTASSNTFKNNTINGNSGGGMLFGGLGAQNNVVEANLVSSNIGEGFGFGGPSASNNTIRNNNIIGNQTGISIYVNGSGANYGNRFYGNNIIGNTTQAKDESTETDYWDNGASGGNYWSDWTTPDANSDGFVDTPRAVAGGFSQDNYPLTQASASITINAGATNTTSTSVTLTLFSRDANSAVEMKFSNDNVSWTTAEAFATSKAWTLSSGLGIKTVYVTFKDNSGNWSAVYSDTITLSTTSLAAGTITTIAGNGTAAYSGDGGAATSASLYNPFGMAVDSSGNVYIADRVNQRIRKVDASGAISTFAGNGTAGYSGDGGAATSASINYPHGMAVDSSGNVYIADGYNNRIRKVDTSGVISTFAGGGTGGDGGAATSASLIEPTGVALDSSGNVYISDFGNNRIRKVNTSGVITTVAGNGTAGYSGDGGAATSASINNPYGVTVDSSGNVYISDQANHRIRKVNTSGVISTFAGNGTGGYSGDGGIATSASLYHPTRVAVDSSGNVYIADCWNHRIRKVNTSGVISTFAGNGSGSYSGDGGAATSASIRYPYGVTLDSSGNVYIADSDNNRIRKVEGSLPVYITSATSTTANGQYKAGSAINITLNFSETVSSTGLTINLNSGASITTGALSSVTSFSGTYTVGAGQTSADLSITSITGTIADAASNNTINPAIPAGQNIGDTKAIVIDTTVPVVSAGANQTKNAQFTQTATATDTNSMTYSWTKQSGPGTITFGTSTAISTTISADTNGIYTIRFTATDAAGNSAFSDMSLTWGTYTLSLTKSGTGTGSVTPDTGTIVWAGNSGSDSYNSGTIVTLTATPDSGSVFTGWSGACSGTGTCQVTMGMAKSATANFAANTYGNGYWMQMGDMTAGRSWATSVLLPNGKILIAGGCAGNGNPVVNSSAELFDPSTGLFSATGSLTTARCSGFDSGVLLPNGKVLISGGGGSYGSYHNSAELYDPVTGLFTLTGNMNTIRAGHKTVLLPNGKVLLIGGSDGANRLSSAELYDPDTGTFSSTGSMNSQRYNPTATLLSNGKVLIAGGDDSSGAIQTAEIYDPSTGTFSATGNMVIIRCETVSTLLPNGKVLIAGGYNPTSGNYVNSAELYDPATGTFSSTGNMSNARSYHSSILLANGKVLIAGGDNGYGYNVLQSAELYDPGTGTFTLTGSMSNARVAHTYTNLSDGRVLVTGGAINGGPVTATAEIYTPIPMIQLPRTGQSKCYDAAGAELSSCAGSGQDGEIQAGLAWPNPRFTINNAAPDNSNTITDNLTGLAWPKAGTTPVYTGTISTCTTSGLRWTEAFSYVACLNTNNYLGHSDWRLPNINELRSLYNTGESDTSAWLTAQGFSTLQAGYYWSSSTSATYNTAAWAITAVYGNPEFIQKTAGTYIWPVRTAQAGFSTVAKTGQTACYSDLGAVIGCSGSGQDGELRAGAAWPDQRFSANGADSVTDNLTGLSWVKDGSTPAFTGAASTCAGGTKSWQQALDYVACLNANSYQGHKDWRLPNRNELASLVNTGETNPATWLNGQGFSSIQSDYYWSSSNSVISGTTYAWDVYMSEGKAQLNSMNFGSYVLPVRGGTINNTNYGLEASYPFNGNANDATGNGHNGTVNGAMLTTDRFGNVNSAYSFSGAESFMNASATGLPTASRTVSMWFQTDSVDNYPSLLCYGGNGGPPGTSWIMLVNNPGAPNSIQVDSHFASSQLIYPYSQPPVGSWYNLVATTDTDGTKIYVNGELKASNASYINNTAVLGKQLFVGSCVEADGTTRYAGTSFQGKIDDLRIYNRALSAAEIQTLYTEPALTRSLTVTKSGTGAGSVTPNTGAITWTGNSGSASYTTGTSVTLTANSYSGTVFTGWSGACTGTSTCQVTMDAAKSVTASFYVVSSTGITTLASGLSKPLSIAVDATHVYWSESGTENGSDTLKKMEINSGSVTTLATNLYQLGRIAIDETAVYWTEMSAGTVKKVDKNGGVITTLASGQYQPLTIAVDASTVYWAEYEGNVVHKIGKDGSGLTNLATGRYPRIAIDSTSVYWIESTLGNVKKVGLNGGSVTTLATGLSSPFDIAVDTTSVYWSESVGNAVKKVGINGGTVTTLASGLSSPTSIAVDATNVYWTETVSNTLKKVGITGGTVTTLASGLSSPGGIAIDTTYVYFTEYTGGTVKKVAKGIFNLPNTGQTTSYTSTFGEDHDYAIYPPSYTDNGNGTIKDNVTGLVWQKQDDGQTRTFSDGAAYCNGLSLGGQTDWRLPSVMELLNIADYSRISPAINSTYFTITTSPNYYMSSTTPAGNADGMLYVTFETGNNGPWPKTDGSFVQVRCVSGGQLASGPFVDNGNGTVSDNSTGLMWQKGEGGSMPWESALNYCEGSSLAGHTDWKLPNVKELASLVDWTRSSPSIHPLFSSSNSSPYWTSTTYATVSPYAWWVSFVSGMVFYGDSTNNGYGYKTGTNYVRCVRSVAAPFTLTLTKSGTGSGSITANTGSISWTGNSGSASFATGTVVTLTAVPDSGSIFSNWNGCDSVSGANNSLCTVTMSAAKSATATFTLNDFSITSGNINVVQGDTRTTTLTLTSTAGFSPSVSLTSVYVGTAPTGATVNFSQSPVTATPSGATATLSFVAGAATPTGSYTIRVSGTDGTITRTKDVTVVVKAPLAISTSSLSAAVKGQAYTAGTAATGGVGAYSFTVSSGTLPAGITLAANGAFSGTPTTRGVSNFTIQAVDSDSHTITKSFSIRVYDLAYRELLLESTSWNVEIGGVSGSVFAKVVDDYGADANVATTTTINIASSSATGRFSVDYGTTYSGSSTYVLTINQGFNVVEFQYKDTTAGTFTLTASGMTGQPSQGWISGAHAITVIQNVVPQYTLTVSKSGTGSGVVTPDSGTLVWNSNSGTSQYDTGTAVQLTATPDSASAIGAWSGCGSVSGAGNTVCSVTMTTAKFVTITFNDTAPPNSPAVTSVTPLTTNTKPSWTWTSGGNGGSGVFRFRLDNSELTGSTETTLNSYTPGTALPDGSHTLYVQERDVAGNWSVSGSFSVAVDTAGPVGGGVAALPKTGQTKCYNAIGTEITCVGTGQDGELKRGVAWPNPRFSDNSNGTITDNLTGLLWLKNANCTETIGGMTPSTRLEAITWSNVLASGKCGLTDASTAGQWRLPSRNELESLVNEQQPNSATWLNTQGFANVLDGYYSTGSTQVYNKSYTYDPDAGWVVNMGFGNVGGHANYGIDYVWPVRDSGTTAPAPVSKTGQTTSYVAGDDGALQPGVAWPSPRFMDNGDQTMTDMLSGLVWSTDANTPGPAVCGPGTTKSWQGALDYVKCLNTNAWLGHNDWSLPNRKELSRMLNLEQANHAIWLNLQGFVNVHSDNYWSGSTSAYSSSDAWYVNMYYGFSEGSNKSLNYYVWPVRGFSSSIAINTNAATTNSISVNLTFTASDPSGVDKIMISNGTDFTGAEETAYFTTPVPWSLIPGDGLKTVYVKFKDTLGNWSQTYSATITLDTTTILSVTKAGAGNGIVTANSGTISWSGASGSASYAPATQVTLSASVGTGSSFVSWTGCDSTSGANNSDCTVTMSTGKSVIATFDRAANTITFPAIADQTYGAADFAPGATAASGLAVSYASSNTAVATIINSKIHIVGAGSVTITASQAGNASWVPADNVQQLLTVNKAQLTITADNKGKLFNTTNPTLTWTPTGFVNNDPPAVLSGAPTLATIAVTDSVADIYPVTISQGTLTAANYRFTFVPGSLTVSSGSQTISFGALAPKSYGAADFDPGASCTSGLAISYSSSNPLVATIVNNKIHITGAGSATITASQTGDANWQVATPVEQLFTVNKAQLAVTAESKSRVYGSANPLLTFTIGGFANGENTSVVSGTPLLSTTANPSSQVSSYPITVDASSLTAANYSFTPVNGALSVTKAQLTITAANQSRGFGEANPSFAWSAAGFVNNEDATVLTGSPALATIATPASPISSYSITISQGTLTATNYSFTFVPGTLAVSKSNQNINFGSVSAKAYGAADFDPVATATSGLAVAYSSDNPLVATIVNNKIHITGTGSAIITASQAGDANWQAAANILQTLTVNKAQLTITAESKSRVAGEVNPPLTWTVAGFVNNENSMVLSGSPLLATAANQSSLVGSYAITIAQGSLAATNYSFTFVDGALAITPPLAITATTAPDGVKGTAYTLTLSTTGGVGAVTFSLTGGTLPGGLTLLNSGIITGTPNVRVVSADFTITATDSQGHTANRQFTMRVYDPAYRVLSLDATSWVTPWKLERSAWSEPIIVRVLNDYGQEAPVVSDTSINVRSSSSSTGKFSIGDGLSVSVLTIRAGFAVKYVYYMDSAAGSPTITVSGKGDDLSKDWTSASHVISVVNPTLKNAAVSITTLTQNAIFGQGVNIVGYVTDAQTNAALGGKTVQIAFTPPNSATPLTYSTLSELNTGRYAFYADPSIITLAGSWGVSASFKDGVVDYNDASTAENFTVAMMSTSLSIIPDKGSLAPTGTINVAGMISGPNPVDWTGQSISVVFIEPDGVTSHIIPTTADRAGRFQAAYGPFDNARTGIWTVTAKFAATASLLYGQSPIKSFTVASSAGYVILIEGSKGGQYQGNYTQSLDDIYAKLKERQFTDENIKYLTYEASRTGSVYLPTTKDNVQQAIKEWAYGQMSKNGVAPLYIVMIDHGSKGAFLIDPIGNDSGSDKVITPADLNEWLNNLETNVKNILHADLTSVIINGTCYSGSFIGAPLSKQGRIIVTSSTDNEQSVQGPSFNSKNYGEYFIYYLFNNLMSMNLYDAFVESAKNTEGFRACGKSDSLCRVNSPSGGTPGRQHPQLDDGDGIGKFVENLGANDGTMSKRVGLGMGTNAVPLAWKSVTPTMTVMQGSGLVLQGETTDPANTLTAWVEIRKPGYIMPTVSGGSGQVVMTLPRVTGQPSGNMWQFDITSEITEPGQYTLYYYAMDNSPAGNVTNPQQVTLYLDTAGNLAPNPFTLISPVDDEVVSDNMILFHWNETLDPDNDPVTYTLKVYDDANNSLGAEAKRYELISGGGFLINTSTETRSNGITPLFTTGGYYWWEVEAVDSNGKSTVTGSSRFQATFTNGLLGVIKGYVTNASGAPIAKATVAASSGASILSFSNGAYLLNSPTGVTNLTITANGYESGSISNITVTAGGVSVNDVMLQNIATAPGSPVIGTAKPGNGQVQVSFTAPASDGGGAITGYTVTSSPGNISASGASSPITVTGLNNGTSYIFTVTATNSLGTGSPSAESVSVTPLLLTPDISAPSSMVTRSANSVTYSVSYSGAETVTLASGNVSLNKTGSASGSIAVNGSGNTRTVTISSITGDGALGISIATGTAVDQIGGLAVAAGPSASFIVDNTNPTLSVSTLSNNAATNASPLNISGTVTDTNGIALLTINGAPVTVGTGGSYSYALTLAVEGDIVVTVVATDNAGNKTTDSRTIKYDVTLPILTISAPPDNSQTKDAALTVTGTVSENGTVEIRNTTTGTTIPAAVTGTNYSGSIQLASGSNTIEVIGTDLAGNRSTSLSRTILYDPIPPALAITDPSHDILLHDSAYTTKGTVTDQTNTVVTLTFNGSTYTPAVTAGQFEQAITFPQEGSFQVVVTATDAVGNPPATATRNIIYTLYPGDSNGDGSTTSLVEVLKAFQYVYGDGQLTASELLRLDCAPLGADGKPNPNGVVDTADIILLLRRVVGLVSW